ncbi:rRNA adenine N-6-methyltransferase family protein [Methanopyrus sp.]
MTRSYLVFDVRRYRELAEELVEPEDIVVEVGAAAGDTTVRLARNARLVIAFEKSDEMFERLRERVRGLDNVIVLCEDGFELGEVLKRTERVDAVFIDVGGGAQPRLALALWEAYYSRFRPRVIVVRNRRLCRLVETVERVECDEEV